MSECTARRDDIELGPNTEVSIECGLSETAHLNTHVTQHKVDDVRVTFTWPGEFVSAKGEGGGE